MKSFIVLILVIAGISASEPNKFVSIYAQPYYSPPYRQTNYYPAFKAPSYPQPPYFHPPYHQTPPQYKAYGAHNGPAYGNKQLYCNPTKVPKCAANTTATICFSDPDYPEYEIQRAIDYDALFFKKYVDLADQSADDLIDRVASAEEKAFDYSNYNGNAFEKGNWLVGEGYICPSEVHYARPVRAVNVKGEWRVIVQDVAYYTQTQRMETCLFHGASCRTLAPCYKSQCVQKYVYHRMLSFDPCDPHKGLFIDIYKLPSACSCHVPNL